MANSVSSFFQTLVASATEASQLLAPTWAAHDAIYWDYNPAQPTDLGQTLNVPIPADPTTNVVDIGSGDVTISDISYSTKSIVYNKHPQITFAVRDFEQFNSPIQLRNLYTDTALKAIKNSINSQIVGLFNTTNFTTNSQQSTTSHIITVPQFLTGRSLLADQKVPVNDVKNMALLLPSTPYMALMDGTTSGSGAAWSQAFIVGEKTASQIHELGTIPVAFSTQVQLDQQMTTTGTVGSRTFTGALFHRWAIAGVSRPLPTPEMAAKVVDYAYVNWGGLVLRIMVGYNQYPKGAALVTIDCGYGLSVVRENMGVLFSIAE